MTRRIMLDIETLATHNTNSVVLSVGAVEWTMNKQGPIFLNSNLWVLDLNEQFALGRITHDSTIKWWQQQTPAARKHWANCDSRVSLTYFRDRLSHMIANDPECEVWAKGIMFDLGNVASLYEQASDPLPWHYRAPSCMRMLPRLGSDTPLRERPPGVDVGPAHDPVADCKEQIWTVWEHWSGDLPNAPEPVGEPVEATT